MEPAAVVTAGRQVLCRLAEVPANEGKELFVVADAPRSIILLREKNGTGAGAAAVGAAGANVNAWINRCPHVGTALNMLPDRFLTSDKQHLHCCSHDAIFNRHDGVCVSGPCVGQSLTPVVVTVEHLSQTVQTHQESGGGPASSMNGTNNNNPGEEEDELVVVLEPQDLPADVMVPWIRPPKRQQRRRLKPDRPGIKAEAAARAAGGTSAQVQE
jgi:nitrite reductase/ring-hydroxylating ferredoxin subunit